MTRVRNKTDMINLKSNRSEINSSSNLQRSNLVWAMFENVALSETAA